MVSYGCLLKKKILWFDLMVVHVDGCPVDGCPLTNNFDDYGDEITKK